MVENPKVAKYRHGNPFQPRPLWTFWAWGIRIWAEGVGSAEKLGLRFKVWELFRIGGPDVGLAAWGLRVHGLGLRVQGSSLYVP